MEDDNEADIQSRRSNEVLAREGIDTLQKTLELQLFCLRSNEVLAREGINKIITL